MPDEFHVFSERVRLPAPGGLQRQRLIDPLVSVRAPRLGVVVATAGAGKTTLLSQLAATSGVPVAWYRAASEDASEAALARHLSRALAGALGLPLPTDPPLENLLAAVDGWGGPDALLIIDDLHEIAGSAAERALERFIELRPATLRVLLGSRRPPQLNLSRLRVAGQVAELTTEDLRFRSWEVEQLFVEVYEQPLRPEAAAALARRTGGWAAALQMFRLATAGKTAIERQQAVADLAGRSRLVRSYLARNVLAELPDRRRWFLTRTSALGVMSGALCDELLETNGSAAVLEDLERAELFTSSHDDGRTFRYHQVLQTHLETALLEELGANATREWYARSGRLLEAGGHTRDALRALSYAEDWASVGRIVQQSGSELGAAALGWYDAVPLGIREHDPWLALSDARRRLRQGSVARAVQAFREAEDLLADPEFASVCRTERALARAWLQDEADGAAMARRPRHWTEELRAALLHGPVAPAAAPSPGLGAGHQLAASVGALVAGDLRTARLHGELVASSAGVTTAQSIAATLALAVVDALTGTTQDLPARLEALSLTADVEGQPWLARLAHGLLDAVLVGCAVTSWRPTTSAGYLIECERDGDEWGAGLLQLAAGAVDVVAGDCRTDRLDDAARRFDRLGAPVLSTWARALAAMGQARTTDPRSVPSALDSEASARRYGVPGARALALAVLAADAGGTGTEERRRDARALAHECGITLPAALRSPRPPVSGAAPREVAASMQLTCFGGFRLEVDGHQVTLGGVRPRATSLLRLMSLHIDADLHRELLIDSLWPDTPVAAGIRSLQVAVSSVRRALDAAGLPGADVVVRHGDSYRLVLPPDSSCDVDDLDHALHRAQMASTRGDAETAAAARRAALALHRGELLPEEGPADWVVSERERLRLGVAEAALELAEHCRARDELRDALPLATQSVQLDPYSDRAWRLLAAVYSECGDATAAARTREQHRGVLEELEGSLTVGAGRRDLRAR